MVKYTQATLDATFHALADPTRRAMLQTLSRRGTASASELGAPHDISAPAISRHLRVLEDAGLVTRQVSGRRHEFRLDPARLHGAEHWLQRQQHYWEQSLARLEQLLKPD